MVAPQQPAVRPRPAVTAGAGSATGGAGERCPGRAPAARHGQAIPGCAVTPGGVGDGRRGGRARHRRPAAHAADPADRAVRDLGTRLGSRPGDCRGSLAAARVQGGSAAAGQQQRAAQVLGQIGSSVLISPHISVTRTAGTATVQITGTAEGVLPCPG